MSIISRVLAAFKTHGKAAPRPIEIDKFDVPDSEENFAFALPDTEHPVVMVSGRAGTGKSTLVRRFLRDDNTDKVVVAPTGIAALTVGGQTIHSFFGFPLHILDVADIARTHNREELFNNLKLLVIDEMSMVRADMLDAIDRSLRLNRNDNRPFGGVGIVLVGDLLQLPPVVKPADLPVLHQYGYRRGLIIEAKVFTEIRLKFVNLKRVHRQDDPEFINMLSDIRIGKDVVRHTDSLNAKCLGEHRSNRIPMILAPRNPRVSVYNERKLQELPGRLSEFHAIIQGNIDPLKDKFPPPKNVRLKVNARVVMLKNDKGKDKRWVNGSLGTVAKIDGDKVFIRIDGSAKAHRVEPETWEKTEYKWNREKAKIVPEVVGTFSQLPLKAAWALTIHKAQGLTLKDVRIDLRPGAFATGQTYVALSRATSIAGLSLGHPIAAADVRVDDELLEFERRIEAEGHDLTQTA